MASIDLKSVRKTYSGGFEAVKGVSLAVPDGALCVLVGPSGCGKSTLLRMVAGLETVTDGEIAIGGRRVNESGPAERDIAMVFQTYALYPHMSVYDNMAYGLRNRGVAKGEIDRRVREAAATLELAALLERRPRELSGGQRQRVAMGRAIVRDPKAFLFDEPLSNLDAKLRGQMRVEIRRLQRSLGVTSIYVTHDQLEAMTLADLLVVMNNGRIEQAGTPLGIYDQPATTFVAGFIGAPPMNLLPVRAKEDALVFADGNRLGRPATAGAPAVLGFRPEDTIVGDADGQGAIRLPPFKVDALETVGAETYLHGQVGGGAAIVRVASRHSARPGEDLVLAVPAGKLHHFDRNGQRL